MIVVDASAMIELLLQTALGRRVEERLFSSRERLHAPHLLDVEVMQAMRRIVLARDVIPARAEEALEDLGAIDIVRHGHRDLLQRAWELRRAVSGYDAMYLALAEALGATLVTCDRRLAGSHGHSVRVEVVGR